MAASSDTAPTIEHMLKPQIVATRKTGGIAVEAFSSCHGLTDKYPWELPIGYGDQFGKDLTRAARGVAKLPSGYQRLSGFAYEAEDGFILTAPHCAAQGSNLGVVPYRTQY